MKKSIVSFALLLLLLLPGCGTVVSPSARFTVATTTYPLYLFTQMVTEGVEDIGVLTIINQPISCPHDYSLTVDDMKRMEQADLLIENGGGLEPFLPDLLAANPNLPVIDSSEGIELLPYQGHDGSSDEVDPHIWMDPNRAAQMVEHIAAGLSQADPQNAAAYESNAKTAAQALREYASEISGRLANVSCRELVTFHDGFGYLANACNLTVIKSIEEEAGSEVSAKEISNLAALIKENNIPAVFCEENGSDSAAKTIAAETGAAVGTLNLMMSGSETPETPNRYYTLMDQNVTVLLNCLQENGGQA